MKEDVRLIVLEHLSNQLYVHILDIDVLGYCELAAHRCMDESLPEDIYSLQLWPH